MAEDPRWDDIRSVYVATFFSSKKVPRLARWFKMEFLGHKVPIEWVKNRWILGNAPHEELLYW